MHPVAEGRNPIVKLAKQAAQELRSTQKGRRTIMSARFSILARPATSLRQSQAIEKNESEIILHVQTFVQLRSAIEFKTR
jgi:hypothetical protein